MAGALQDSIQQATGKSYLSQAIATSKQVIIADADIVTNQVDVKRGPLPMGMMPYEEYQFANHEFFVNTIAYLNEPIGLLDSRNKQNILRLLNHEKVADNRILVQIILVLGPLLLLGAFFFIWAQYRKRQFAI
jgi:hypothetical protein